MQDNRDYIVANGEFRELIKNVAVLSTKVDSIEKKFSEMGQWQCPVHTEQIATIRRDLDTVQKVQGQVTDTIGKRNVIAGVISMVTAATMAYLVKGFK